MRRGDGIPLGVSAVILVLICSACVATCAFEHSDRETVTVLVTEKDIVRHGSGDTSSDYYMVWTTRNGVEEVFTVNDSLIEGNWDTSDDYGRIHVGECYEFEVYGWRIQFMSNYRNIVSIRGVPCP